MVKGLDGNWVESYRKYLYFLANRHLTNEIGGQSASDFVQETMARAVEKIDQCQATNEAQRRGWLRQILVNQIRLMKRRLGSKAALATAPRLEADLNQSSQGIENLVAACHTSVRAGAIHREELELMLCALGRLPPDQRQVVELRHLEGLPVAKIAESMHTTIPSVAGLLRRGLQRLRRELGEQSRPYSQ